MNLSLGLIADIASLIGLAITAFTLFRVSEIRKEFLLRARLPRLGQRLEELRATLNEDLGTYATSKHSAEEKIERALSVVESISRKLNGADREKFKKISINLKRELSNGPTEQSARRCHLELAHATENLSDILESLQWRT